MILDSLRYLYKKKKKKLKSLIFGTMNNLMSMTKVKRYAIITINSVVNIYFAWRAHFVYDHFSEIVGLLLLLRVSYAFTRFNDQNDKDDIRSCARRVDWTDPAFYQSLDDIYLFIKKYTG